MTNDIEQVIEKTIREYCLEKGHSERMIARLQTIVNQYRNQGSISESDLNIHILSILKIMEKTSGGD